MPPALGPLTSYRPPVADCYAGVARRDVTPPVGIQSCSWGAALHETAEGVHRPFTATALSVGSKPDAKDARLVLLSIDLGWLEKQEMAELLESVRTAAELNELSC